MSTVKVSIVVPCFNMEDKISKCLNSLANQTLKDIEIIVVNDASTDNSESEISKYCSIDPRIKLINHVVNKRRGGARNTGINHSRGEYIGWVDADDWVDEKMFEYLYNAAKLVDADIAQCNYFNQYPDGKFSRIEPIKKALVLRDRDILNSLYTYQRGLFAGLCNKIYKRSLFVSNDIKFADAYHEDGPINIQLAYYAKKMVHVPRLLYYYYHYGKNTSLEVTNLSIDEMIISTDIAYKFIVEKDISKKEFSAFIKNFYFRRIVISKLNDIFKSRDPRRYTNYLARKIDDEDFRFIIENVGTLRMMLVIALIHNYPLIVIRAILRLLITRDLLLAKLCNA